MAVAARIAAPIGEASAAPVHLDRPAADIGADLRPHAAAGAAAATAGCARSAMPSSSSRSTTSRMAKAQPSSTRTGASRFAVERRQAVEGATRLGDPARRHRAGQRRQEQQVVAAGNGASPPAPTAPPANRRRRWTGTRSRHRPRASRDWRRNSGRRENHASRPARRRRGEACRDTAPTTSAGAEIAGDDTGHDNAGADGVAEKSSPVPTASGVPARQAGQFGAGARSRRRRPPMHRRCRAICPRRCRRPRADRRHSRAPSAHRAWSSRPAHGP